MKELRMFFVFFILSAATLGASETLTLEDCLSLAKKENSKILAKKSFEKAASHKKTAALFNFFPKGRAEINMLKHVFVPEPEDVSFDISSLGIPGMEGSVELPVDIPERSREMNISAVQPVTDLWSVYKAYDITKRSENISEMQTQITENNVKKTVISSFYSYLMAKDLKDLLLEMKKQTEEYKKQAKHFVREGMSDKRAVLKMDIEISRVKKEMATVDENMKLLKNAVAVAINRDESSFELEEKTTVFRPVEKNISEMISMQKKYRNEFKIMEESIVIMKNMEHLAFQPLIPSIALTGGFRKTWDPQPFAPEGIFFAGGVLQWEVGFDWVANYSSYKKSVAETTGKNLENIDAKKQMRLQLLKMHRDIKVAAEEIKLAEAEIAAAEESLHMEKKKYQENMTTETELLSAHISLKKAKTDFLRAKYTHEIKVKNLSLTTKIPEKILRKAETHE
ncbi:MAG: TolC family protein [bacterium]